MALRPTVRILGIDNKSTGKALKMPGVFRAPLRQDLVSEIHDLMRSNNRQPHGVSKTAGVQVSAESWGTGRAVARIPRVRGGGTHRSGQGAYGNMCRGGHMFAPLKVNRKLHHKVNVKQRRYALASAVAATGFPALAMARGHMVNKVSEFPLVIANAMEEVKKTKDAQGVLRAIGAWKDIQKVYKSKSTRAGRGKIRNRRNVQKRGPIIIYKNDNGLCKAFRNIPGTTLIPVDKLNLLKLAPGGKLGRFAIYTESAFKELDNIFGTPSKESKVKKGFHVPNAPLTNPELLSLLKSKTVRKAMKKPNMDGKRRLGKARVKPLYSKRLRAAAANAIKGKKGRKSATSKQ